MEVVVLLVVQLLATVAGFALVWRKLERTGLEVKRVRRLLETLELARFGGNAPQPGTRRAPSTVRTERVYTSSAPVTPLRQPSPYTSEAPWPRTGVRSRAADAATQRRSLPRQFLAVDDPASETPRWRTSVSPETGRVIAAAFSAVAPALGFAFGAPTQALIAAGLSIAGVLMLIALRPLWRAASWISVLAAGSWSIVAFAIGAAHSAPVVFSIFAAFAGAAGLVHARVGRATPGAIAALLMGGATLALGMQLGLIGPAGAAFGALVAIASLIGASSLRVEGLHFAGFAAAGIGLYVLSGQTEAAIWFTPVAAWLGALFLAIAAVRVPVLAARGLLLAATGSIAPLVAAWSLYRSNQGLADPYAAAAAFACLAVIFAGILTMSARRRDRGVTALHLTSWMLSGAAVAASSAAIFLAAPVPVSAALMGCMALGLVAFDRQEPNVIWRFFASVSLAIAALAACIAMSYAWPMLALIAVAIAIPSLLAAYASLISRRRAPFTSGFFEASAICGAVATISLLLRYALSGGQPTAQLGFVEAGAHIAAWLAVALALSARAEHGARAVRRTASTMLSVMAMSACTVAGLLWLTPWWSAQPVSGIDWAVLQHAPLGFALPAAVAWAHWPFWRRRNAHLRTRIALGGAALVTAAFVTLEVVVSRGAMTAPSVDWVSLSVGVLSLALAIGINFAPGVTAGATAREPSPLDLDEYLESDRRSEQRRQPR